MFVGFSIAAGDGFRLRLHSKIKGGQEGMLCLSRSTALPVDAGSAVP